MSARKNRSRRLVVTAVASLAALAFAAPASAGVLVADAPSCADLSAAQVFLPWADVASYELAPGGTLEDGAPGWTLNGSAAVVSGNEHYNVHSAGDSQSLSLPNPSSAVTGETCVGIDHPTLRFFGRRSSGSPFGSVRVDVTWEDADGNDVWTTIGVVGFGNSWSPSPTIVITPALLPLLPGSMTPVAFRFVPQGADFQVDDVYVDPMGGH